MNRRELLAALSAVACGGVSGHARAATTTTLQVLGAPNASTIVLVHLLQTPAWQAVAPPAEFRLWRDTDELRAGVASGQTKLFTTPSHVPALFASRGVPIRLLAVISMGHLYILSDDPSLTTLAALRGRRVTTFFRNDMPDLVFRALLRKEGLEPGRDLDVDYVGTPMEAAQLAVAGRAPIVLLSEPPATMAVAKAQTAGRTLHRVISLQDEWGRHFGRPRIPMAGVALHQSLIDRQPELLAALRHGLAESAAWVLADPEDAATLAQATMDIPAPVFLGALPHLNIEVVGARQMRDELMEFYRVLLALNPDAIGGRLPDETLFLDL